MGENPSGLETKGKQKVTSGIAPSPSGVLGTLGRKHQTTMMASKRSPKPQCLGGSKKLRQPMAQTAKREADGWGEVGISFIQFQSVIVYIPCATIIYIYNNYIYIICTCSLFHDRTKVVGRHLFLRITCLYKTLYNDII